MAKSNAKANKPKSVSDESIAAFFSVMGDPTRIKILKELLEEEQNVGSLSEKLGLSISAVSHQLRILRNHDLVRYRREGKFIYYRISDIHVSAIIQTGWDHLSEEEN